MAREGGGGWGEESLHSVCLCILEHNDTSTARFQPILTINYNTYKLVQLSQASKLRGQGDYKDFHGERSRSRGSRAHSEMDAGQSMLFKKSEKKGKEKLGERE